MITVRKGALLMQSASWVLWNLFLAAIPAVLAYLFAWGAERYTVRKKTIPWMAWLAAGAGLVSRFFPIPATY